MRPPSEPTLFAKEFFDLQFYWAEAVQRSCGIPLERALLEHTNFYVRLGLGRDLDGAHPGWQAYLAGLRSSNEGREWTYRCYLNNREANTAPPVVATFGCFSYAIHEGNIVRLHFRHADRDGVPPLARASAERRRSELRALFTHVRATVAGEGVVGGISWLYNLDAYRRLFPAVYTATRQPMPGRFHSMSLWGQFLDHHGQVKEDAQQRFLSALHAGPAREALADCFPLRTLSVQAPVQAFYEFYTV